MSNVLFIRTKNRIRCYCDGILTRNGVKSDGCRKFHTTDCGVIGTTGKASWCDRVVRAARIGMSALRDLITMSMSDEGADCAFIWCHCGVMYTGCLGEYGFCERLKRDVASIGCGAEIMEHIAISNRDLSFNEYVSACANIDGVSTDCSFEEFALPESGHWFVSPEARMIVRDEHPRCSSHHSCENIMSLVVGAALERHHVPVFRLHDRVYVGAPNSEVSWANTGTSGERMSGFKVVEFDAFANDWRGCAGVSISVIAYFEGKNIRVNMYSRLQHAKAYSRGGFADYASLWLQNHVKLWNGRLVCDSEEFAVGY